MVHDVRRQAQEPTTQTDLRTCGICAPSMRRRHHAYSNPLYMTSIDLHISFRNLQERWSRLVAQYSFSGKKMHLRRRSIRMISRDKTFRLVVTELLRGLLLSVALGLLAVNEVQTLGLREAVCTRSSRELGTILRMCAIRPKMKGVNLPTRAPEIPARISLAWACEVGSPSF